jgi:hypothetical protein
MCCATVDEATGTAQLMAETGYANKEDQKPGDRGHCHNYLFARVGDRLLKVFNDTHHHVQVPTY